MKKAMFDGARIFKRTHPEDDLAVAIADYFERAMPESMRNAWWHVPNGGKRNKREAARFKKQGVKAGVSDLHFILPSGKLGVIELKIKPNGCTPEQKRFLNTVVERSHMASVCHSLREVVDTLREWGVNIPVPQERVTFDQSAARVEAARRVA